MKFPKLSRKQINVLTEGKKHWSEKKDHLIKRAKNYGIIIQNDEELRELVEVHCPNEEKRIRREYFKDSLSGKRWNNITPTDVKGTFEKVDKPVIGQRYHISWAFSGAIFVLKKIEGDLCYLDNPKYKRDKLLTCKVEQLRKSRR
jgi:hypothetical protein